MAPRDLGPHRPPGGTQCHPRQWRSWHSATCSSAHGTHTMCLVSRFQGKKGVKISNRVQAVLEGTLLEGLN
eukprot:283494-Prorocentrum_minimum.AAC.3